MLSASSVLSHPLFLASILTYCTEPLTKTSVSPGHLRGLSILNHAKAQSFSCRLLDVSDTDNSIRVMMYYLNTSSFALLRPFPYSLTLSGVQSH